MSLLNATTSGQVDDVTMTSLPSAEFDYGRTMVDREVNCTERMSGGGDQLMLDVSYRLVHGTIIPLLAAVGMALNCLNLIVLTSGRLTDSSYTYLTGLAVADGGMLALFLVNGIGRGHFPNSGRWRQFEAYVYFPCGFVATTAGLLLTVAVSAERCVFIYAPIRARTWCSRRTARTVTASIWAFCVVANVPRWFVFDVDLELGRLRYGEFGRSPAYAFMSWFHLLVMSCGSGLALTVLNVLLVRGLRRTANRRRRVLQRGQRRRTDDQRRLTRTLISIVTVFLIGEIPSALTSRALVVALSGDPCLVETSHFKITSLVTTVLIVLQLSSNFVLYCALNRRFWAVLTDQLRACRPCRRSECKQQRQQQQRQNRPQLVNNNDDNDDHHHHQQLVTATTLHDDQTNVDDQTQQNGLM